METSDRKVVLATPLAPNINHQGTAFGGSIQSAALLGCWSLGNTFLDKRGVRGSVIVADCQISFVRPIKGEWTSEATWKTDTDLDLIYRDLITNKKARAQVQCTSFWEGEICAQLSGKFVFRLKS